MAVNAPTQTALTEAEIRAAIQFRLDRYPNDDPRKALREAVEDLAQVLTGPAFDVLESPTRTAPADIWGDDLRPSEAMVLRRHGRAVIDRAVDRALELIVAEVVDGCLAAAAEIPGAPRAAVADELVIQ